MGRVYLGIRREKKHGKRRLEDVPPPTPPAHVYILRKRLGCSKMRESGTCRVQTLTVFFSQREGKVEEYGSLWVAFEKTSEDIQVKGGTQPTNVRLPQATKELSSLPLVQDVTHVGVLECLNRVT